MANGWCGQGQLRTPTLRPRGPEMYQTAKGKQWYFGMKAHVGVDSSSKVIHSIFVTPTNAADGTMVDQVLHGGESRIYGDQAYRGQRDRIQAIFKWT